MLAIKCSSCGHQNEFDQPYPYHAGFANQGFLYNDEGNLTLVWSSFDPAYQALIGRNHPWMLSPEQHAVLERSLRPAPFGGCWRFINPARCFKCGDGISRSIVQTAYYLVYPDGIVTDALGEGCLRKFLSQQRAG